MPSLEQKRWLLTVLCALGAGLSLYLASLKVFALPCIGGGGCHAVIHSGYGSVFGIPVGVFSGLLWFAAILVNDDTKRRALVALIAVGAAGFMGIQFFILKGFCAYCTAHAAIAWAALFLANRSPRRGAAIAGIALALLGFGLTRWQVANQTSRAQAAAPATQAAKDSPLPASPGALAWLGELSDKSPALVLSVNCAACLDLLEELTKQSFARHTHGPAIFFRVTEQNRELTLAFVSAVLATQEPNRDTFLAHVSLLLSVKDQALSSPDVAAVQLQAFTPAAARFREEAQEILRSHTNSLQSAGVPDTTPLLVPVNGQSRAFFRTEELFR